MDTEGTPDLPRLDARTLRALAHPLRLRLLALLRADGSATASGLAQRVGESSGTTSWHLRQLAEYELIEQDTERGTKRERWWRAKHTGHIVQPKDFSGDPEMTGPLTTYLQSVAEQRYTNEMRFLAEQDSWQPEWSEAAIMDDFMLSLTPDETEELNAEVRTLIERYHREPRAGDTQVLVQWSALPRETRPEDDTGEQQ